MLLLVWHSLCYKAEFHKILPDVRMGFFILFNLSIYVCQHKNQNRKWVFFSANNAIGSWLYKTKDENDV
jgi:hypothetical protein